VSWESSAWGISIRPGPTGLTSRKSINKNTAFAAGCFSTICYQFQCPGFREGVWVPVSSGLPESFDPCPRRSGHLRHPGDRGSNPSQCSRHPSKPARLLPRWNVPCPELGPNRHLQQDEGLHIFGQPWSGWAEGTGSSHWHILSMQSKCGTGSALQESGVWAQPCRKTIETTMAPRRLLRMLLLSVSACFETQNETWKDFGRLDWVILRHAMLPLVGDGSAPIS
jgi:hypothetical protein